MLKLITNMQGEIFMIDKDGEDGIIIIMVAFEQVH